MSDDLTTPPIIAGYILQPCSDELRANLQRINSPLCQAIKAVAPMLAGIRNKSATERAEIIGLEFVLQLSSLPDSMDATNYIFVTEQAKVKRLLDEGYISFKNAVEKEFGRHLSQDSRHGLFKACSLLFLERLCQDANKLAGAMN